MNSRELHELAKANASTSITVTCGELAKLAMECHSKIPTGDGDKADATRDAIVAFEKCGNELAEQRCSVESAHVLLVSSLLFGTNQQAEPKPTAIASLAK